MTGSQGDMNLSLDFMSLIGKLERQANTASRSGQYDDLHGLARELTEWQKRLRRAFVLALGDDDLDISWATLVNQVSAVRHQRDGAQRLHRIAADDLTAYDHQFVQQREELNALREEAQHANTQDSI